MGNDVTQSAFSSSDGPSATHSTAPTAAPDHTPHMPALDSLDRLNITIGDALGGTLVSERATSFVIEYLKEQGYEELAIVAVDLTSALESRGCSVTLESFAAKTMEHPVLVMTARLDSGEYAFPNLNLSANPAIPLSMREDGPVTEKRTLVESDSMEADPMLRNLRFDIERFPKDAPVRILIGDPHDAELPFHIEPVFSDRALEVAQQHVLDRLNDHGRNRFNYSVLFDEVLVPFVRNEIRCESQNEQFGQHEIPEVAPAHRNADGATIGIRYWVPLSAERSEERQRTVAFVRAAIGVGITAV